MGWCWVLAKSLSQTSIIRYILLQLIDKAPCSYTVMFGCFYKANKPGARRTFLFRVLRVRFSLSVYDKGATA